MVAATQHKTTAYFIVRNGPAAGQRVDIVPRMTKTLPFPVFVVGRDARCHLTLDDPEVAGMHAFILRDENGDYHIKDNDTHAGTTLDGEYLLREKLYPGCTVRIGGTVLRFDTVENKLADIMREAQAFSAPGGATGAPLPSATIATPSHRKTGKRSGGIGTMLMLVFLAVLAGSLVFAVLSDRRLAAANGPEDYIPVDYASPGNPGTATVLYFSASWCTFCRNQKPIIRDLDNNFGSNVAFREIDIDAPANYQVVNRFGVNSVPRVVILDGWNHVQHQFIGLKGYDPIYQAITDSMNG